jgi:hypothetical protein
MIYTHDQFLEGLCKKIYVGKILFNPGGGTSEIVFIDNNKIVYERGKSKISIKINDIFGVYEKNNGNVFSNKLKEEKPNIFDSRANGHSCNCTFVFMVFKEMGVVNKIEGAGVRGNPFYVNIKK